MKFSRRCDGVTRRSFVQLGALTALGVGCWNLPAVRGASGPPQGSRSATGFGRAKRCILIWLDGGPSHLETFDPKPTAPIEVRGPLGTIATSIPGVRLSECLSRTAASLDNFALVRSMTSPLGEHNLATRYLLTGQRPTPATHYPVLGSLLAHYKSGDSSLPRFAAIPHHRVGGEQFPPQGFLAADLAPFEIGGDPRKPDFNVEGLRYYPGLDADRVKRRAEFLKRLNRLDENLQRHGQPAETDWDRALEFATSPSTRQAFSLESEAQQTRQRYGMTTVGQSCLLARRLVERDVPFVTVNFPGWDTHDAATLRLKEGYTGAQVPVGLVPQLDQALNGLVDDLKQNGLIDETLVVVMGEFGRTPKLNSSGGRDHWPRAFSVALAGGGVPTGQVVGATDARGEAPSDRPVTPGDLAATLLWLLGIDPRDTLMTSDGRPITLVNDGHIVNELVGQ